MPDIVKNKTHYTVGFRAISKAGTIYSNVLQALGWADESYGGGQEEYRERAVVYGVVVGRVARVA